MKKISLLLFIAFTGYSINAFSQGYKKGPSDSKHTYKIGNQDYKVKKYDQTVFNESEKPKNIILFIGDGMGVAQVFSAMVANKNKLYIENFKHIGLSKTQSASDLITDSGAGGTAIACGTKTYNGAIGVNADKQPVKSILELAEENDLATGLVSTSSITHATPASFIAHNVTRKDYEGIAADFLKTDIEVIIGGGKDHFNKRKDGRVLTDELKEKGHEIFFDLDEAKKSAAKKITVLTADEHNFTVFDRGDYLPEATKKAIDVLDNNTNGFFLMVEASQIDWGGHANNTGYIVAEMLDLDKSIAKALEFASKDGQTLIIVTSDHETGGMAVNGESMEQGIVKGKYTSRHHTACMVPVFAIGPGAENFIGIYENSAIFDKMKKAINF